MEILNNKNLSIKFILKNTKTKTDVSEGKIYKNADGKLFSNLP